MKKIRKIGLGIGYVISAIIIIFGTYFLVLLARGNSFDIFTGRLKPTGLLLIESVPGGAQVRLNNKLLRQKTPLRLTNIEPGPIRVSLTKNNFRAWSAISSIQAGQVNFLTYAWLVPTHLQTSNLLDTINTMAVIQTADHKHSALVATKPQLAVWSTDNFVRATNIYQPASTTDPAQTVSQLIPTRISDDGATLLVRQVSTAQTDYVAVDLHGNRQPINISQEFRLNGNPVGFNPSNSQEIFWSDNGSLRKISLSSRTVSAIIADKVAYAIVARNKLYLIQTVDPLNNLYTTDLAGQHKTLVLDGIESSPSYNMLASSYNSQDYIALYIDKSKRLSIYLDNGNALLKSGHTIEGVTNFSFNHSGQFLTIIQNNKLLCYNFDKKQYQTVQTAVNNLSQWLWLDDFHLAITTTAGVFVSDFDGQNFQQLESWLVPTGLATYNHNPIVLHDSNTTNKLDLIKLVEKP